MQWAEVRPFYPNLWIIQNVYYCSILLQTFPVQSTLEIEVRMLLEVVAVFYDNPKNATIYLLSFTKQIFFIILFLFFRKSRNFHGFDKNI